MSSDIYQDSFNYCTPEGIRTDLERLYPVNRVPSRRDPALRQKIIVFNHIGQSGGAPINDLMVRASIYSGVRFLIPAHADVWDAVTYGTHRPVFASGHYLSGLHERIDVPCAYFTVIRDPVRLMGSLFLRRPYVFSGSGLSDVWARLDRHLDEWKDTAGHLNIQTFEIATNDFDKPFRQSPGDPPDVSVHNIRNYPGSNPDDLLRSAIEKIDRRYFLVGITELFEETLFLLFDCLGIDRIPLWRPGIYSYWRPPALEIPIRLRRKIERLTGADQALYERQRNRMEQLMGEVDFGRSLIDYKIACRNPTNRLFLELRERVEIARILSTMTSDPARLDMEMEHVRGIQSYLGTLAGGEGEPPGLKS